MKNYIFLIFIFTSSIYSFSQCQKGDCKNGFSTMKYQDGTYEGYYKDGKLDSLGYMFYTDKKLYQGEFADNQFNGNGYYKWKTGQVHIGSWKNGLQSGLGILKTANSGIQTAGEWVDGKIPNPLTSTSPKNNPKNCIGNCVDGIGKLIFKDSSYVQGIFKNKQIILGDISNKTIIYNGEIKKNIPNGYGQIKYLDTNEYFMGYFKDGKKHGAGIFSNKKNKKVFGKWIEGEYHDPTKFEFNQNDFCTELIALAKLTKKQRKELDVKKEKWLEVIIKKQFLNTFEIRYLENLSLIKDGTDQMSIRFPTTTNLQTIKYNDLKKSCKECNKLKLDNQAYNFTYKDVKINVSNGKILITYPKPDPCISGNCKNGKGKKQFTTSVYEGQFKDSKAHGKGKETWDNGNVFEGQYVNDLRNGNGTFTWNDEKNKGQKYIGGFKNDLRNGQGIYTWPSGTKYIGGHKDNKFSGYGKKYDENGNLFYDGNWENSNFEGQGTYYYSKGAKYIGNWKGSKRDGLGKYYTKDGKINYEGEYKNGEANGKGKLYYSNGGIYEGNWKNNKRNGEGVFTWKNGDKYIGNYSDGKKNGQGRIIWASGYQLIGEFKDGNAHGNVKEYRKDGSIAFGGEYANGKANGLGKLFDNDGKVTFEGQFKDGKKVE